MNDTVRKVLDRLAIEIPAAARAVRDDRSASPVTGQLPPDTKA